MAKKASTKKPVEKQSVVVEKKLLAKAMKAYSKMTGEKAKPGIVVRSALEEYVA